MDSDMSRIVRVPCPRGSRFLIGILVLLECLFFFCLQYNFSIMEDILPVLMVGCALVLGKMRVCIDRTIGFWLLFCFAAMASSAYSLSQDNTIKASFVLLLCWIITALQCTMPSDWVTQCIRMIWLFSFAFSVFTVLQLIFPQYIASLSQVLLPEKAFEENKLALSYGYYLGITDQAGTNSFCCFCLVGISFCRLLCTGDRRQLFPLCIGFFAEMLTGKRQILLAFTFAILLVFLLARRKPIFAGLQALRQSRKRRQKLFRLALAVVALVTIVVLALAAMDSIIIKRVGDTIRELQSGGSVSVGRDRIYQQLLAMFRTRPVFGIGYDAAQSKMGITAHSDYLRVLTELGIVGVCLFLLAVFNTLFSTIRLYRHVQYTRYEEAVLVSVFIQAVYLVRAALSNPFSSKGELLLYCVFVAIGLSAKNQSKAQRLKSEDLT